MTAIRSARGFVLLLLAAALVAGVVGVQLANGGGRFAPARTADPCVRRVVSSASTGLDALGERLVLLGLDGAACRLNVSREALTLQLAESRNPTTAQLDALRAGLLEAVARMKADGTLPRAATLANEALDQSKLNFLLKAAIRALPDSAINSALKTDDVLRRTIQKLDLRTLLSNLDNPDDLTSQINKAVTSAVKASLIARLRGLL